MNSPSTPEGPGPVSGAPHLPDGFADTSTSRYIGTRELRQHVTGGEAPPVLPVHGRPQTWYAWRLRMPTLARHFQIIAPGLRGTALSGKPGDGSDTGTLAADPVARCEALFASGLQRSDAPTADMVAEAIKGSMRRFGLDGCASRMAQEFGDHPDVAAERMRWIRQLATECERPGATHTRRASHWARLITQREISRYTRTNPPPWPGDTGMRPA